MFVWTALYIEDQLEDLRDLAIGIGEDFGVKCPMKVLPMHVSLKISFNIPDQRLDECVEALCSYYSKVGPFSIEPEGFEKNPGIVWLKMKDNERLLKIHSDLDEMVQKDFGVEPHEFDRSFIYHSTMFFDERGPLSEALEALSKYHLPKKILVREFLIGTSESGRPETYSVYKHSRLGNEVSIKDEWNAFDPIQ